MENIDILLEIRKLHEPITTKNGGKYFTHCKVCIVMHRYHGWTMKKFPCATVQLIELASDS